MNNTMEVKTKAGTLVVKAIDDPVHPGIYISLVPNGTNYEMDLVGAEAWSNENGDVRMFAWCDPYTDMYTDEYVISREDIVKAMAIEEE